MLRPTIILVDDDPAVRASLAFSLGLEGFGVEAFASAEALLERRAANPLPPGACLVLDLRLPGMDGLALLELLRVDGAGQPAVIITSNPARGLGDRIAAAGALLIEKPLLCDALTAAIRSLLHIPPLAA
jgi:FixJ family two-component response regulator